MDFFTDPSTHTWSNLMEVIKNDFNNQQQRHTLPTPNEDLRLILDYLRDTNESGSTMQGTQLQRNVPNAAGRGGIIDLSNGNNRSIDVIAHTGRRRHISAVDLSAASADERINGSDKPLTQCAETQGASNAQLANCKIDNGESDDSTLSLLCPVCLDTFEMVKLEGERQLISTVCGHVFCSSCVSNIMHKHKQCPKCRTPIRKNQLRAIFL